jgi:hypothetical protein
MSFYLRCAFCELVIAITGPVMDALDRIGMGRSRLYRLIWKPTHAAWNWLDDAKTELRRRGMPVEV